MPFWTSVRCRKDTRRGITSVCPFWGVVAYIFVMDDDELAEYQVFAKKVAVALRRAFPCKKVAQVVLGLEVPHAHIHLIPMNSEADVNFRKEHLKLSEEEFRSIADRVYGEFQKL